MGFFTMKDCRIWKNPSQEKYMGWKEKSIFLNSREETADYSARVVTEVQAEGK